MLWVELSLLMDLLASVLQQLALELTSTCHSRGQMGLGDTPSLPQCPQCSGGGKGGASTLHPVSLGPAPGKPGTLLGVLGSSHALSEFQGPHLFNDPTTYSSVCPARLDLRL